MRRRSSSSILRTLLWLAYLSADSVAIFVLGHLTVHASRAHHQLISFWAPFVLVHLGEQDTITAFSKQDNELWARHLLSLVTQVGIAGYVVAKVSWPDHRLRNAMVLIFLSGCFKYTERVSCLYLASPPVLRSKSLGNLSRMLNKLHRLAQDEVGARAGILWVDVANTLQFMMEGWNVRYMFSYQCPCMDPAYFRDGTIRVASIINDIMAVDTALNKEDNILDAEYISNQLNTTCLTSNPARRYSRAYEYVGACLVDCYHTLYTKKPLRKPLGQLLCNCAFRSATAACLSTLLLLPYTFFRWVSTPMALLLFRAAEKGGQLHTSSPADVTVSYILLVGALVLDVCAATVSLYGEISHSHRWSEELAQYSMIKRHTAQGMLVPICQWIGSRLGGWGVGLLELTQTPVTQDLKEFILNSLLHLGARKEWNIATSRGKRALQKWMETQEFGSDSARWPGKQVLDHGFNADFPTSVLIWHIATDMCYYFGDNDDDNIDSDQLKKHKQMSRELSNYIMYLVFKCGIMLTSRSQLMHDKAHDEINGILSDHQHRPGEKDAIRKLFEAKNEVSSVGIHFFDRSRQQRLQNFEEAIYSPVLPRAREVAQVLIGIENETERWGLFTTVWLERCFTTSRLAAGVLSTMSI